MSYREYLPPAALRAWVECFWLARRGDAHRVMPDGCADILIELDEAAASVVGTMTVARQIPAVRSGTLVAVRFRPGGAQPWLGGSMRPLTDQRQPLQKSWNERAERLAEVAISGARGDSDLQPPVVQRLAAEMMAEIGRVEAPPRAIARAVARLNCGTRVAAVADELGMSRQQLTRRFQKTVGVGPKALARILRLRRLLAHCAGRRPQADDAFALGYCDQAHMAREVRLLTGESLRLLFASAREVPFFQDAADSILSGSRA
ncbi:MAG: AraC family transcriptional regulator [Acidobacteriota bacterium]